MYNYYVLFNKKGQLITRVNKGTQFLMLLCINILLF